MIAITAWSIPEPRAAIKSRQVLPGGTDWICYWDDKYVKHSAPVSDYLLVTGFWQYWDMFAPDPLRVDKWGDAQVVFRDGSTKRYAYPRMFELPIPQKFLKERYRKFYERAGSDDFVYLWPSFGLRVALLNDNPKNPPMMVKLYRHTRPIAPPGGRQREEYTSENFFTYVVEQKELARLRNQPL